MKKQPKLAYTRARIDVYSINAITASLYKMWLTDYTVICQLLCCFFDHTLSM